MRVICTDELAIEAPSLEKCTVDAEARTCTGVAMAAALSKRYSDAEYAPLKIKMAITGNGQASKEQVADMLQRMLHLAKKRCLSYGCYRRLAAATSFPSDGDYDRKRLPRMEDFIAKNRTR